MEVATRNSHVHLSSDWLKYPFRPVTSAIPPIERGTTFCSSSKDTGHSTYLHKHNVSIRIIRTFLKQDI
jgi:hypothetical protein